jgi:hypothetical protein
MISDFNSSASKPNFTLVWIIIVLFISLQSSYIFMCHWLPHVLQQPIPAEQRLVIRTLFYVMAIIGFPLTRLIRYIQIRLNQTMPGNQSAGQRYLITVIMSQAFMASIGLLGFVMFILGDDFNTLYLFSGLAILGFFIYRPRREEYESIVAALHKAD